MVPLGCRFGDKLCRGARLPGQAERSIHALPPALSRHNAAATVVSVLIFSLNGYDMSVLTFLESADEGPPQ